MAAMVLTGLDILCDTSFAPIAGRRVGLVTHRSAVDRYGVATFDRFRASGRFDLMAVFTPEHGYAAQSDEAVPSSIDSETGIPFYSLYGATRRPTTAMLRDMNLLVFDVQDVGARFYTYITTLAYIMEEAARFGIPLLVLDRPNVINGLQVEGPTLASHVRSFVGYFEFPIRHGMTVAEIACWHNAKAHLGLELHIVQMQGWRRGMWFDETGLPWLPPSPGMRSLTTATLYPGVCCLERTNVSVGRGTDHPFEWVGAPWIDEEALARDLESRRLPGVAFTPVDFTPAASTCSDQVCHGVALEITDRSKLDSVTLGFHLMDSIHRQNPVEFDFGDSQGLIGDEETLAALKSFVPVGEIVSKWQESLQRFRVAREEFLLYAEWEA